MYLTIALAVFIFAFLVGLLFLQHRTQMSNLIKLAARLDDGNVEDYEGHSPALHGVAVVGHLDGHRIRFDYPTPPDGHFMKFVASIEVHAPIVTELSIERAGLTKKFGKSLGLVKSIETGNSAADSAYVINGEQKGATQLLSLGKAQQAIDRLLSIDGIDKIQISDGELQVEKRGDETDPDLLWGIAEGLLKLAKLSDRTEFAHAKLGDRIHFAWTGGTSSPRCPYCHDDIPSDFTEELVSCEKCSTVHHSECLSEAGGCVIFGCGGFGATITSVRDSKEPKSHVRDA